MASAIVGGKKRMERVANQAAGKTEALSQTDTVMAAGPRGVIKKPAVKKQSAKKAKKSK